MCAILESAAAQGNARATLALEMFAYRASKYIGAYAVALGGVEMRSRSPEGSEKATSPVSLAPWSRPLQHFTSAGRRRSCRIVTWSSISSPACEGDPHMSRIEVVRPVAIT